MSRIEKPTFINLYWICYLARAVYHQRILLAGTMKSEFLRLFVATCCIWCCGYFRYLPSTKLVSIPRSQWYELVVVVVVVDFFQFRIKWKIFVTLSKALYCFRPIYKRNCVGCFWIQPSEWEICWSNGIGVKASCDNHSQMQSIVKLIRLVSVLFVWRFWGQNYRVYHQKWFEIDEFIENKWNRWVSGIEKKTISQNQLQSVSQNKSFIGCFRFAVGKHVHIESLLSLNVICLSLFQLKVIVIYTVKA